MAMATGGLVPPLLEPLASPPGGGAPILRARLLEILRVLYEHHPRPKEFIMKFRIQVGGWGWGVIGGGRGWEDDMHGG